MADYSHELGYWESPINQWVEMGRHYVYAEKMGMWRENFWFRCDRRVVDIGGGPCSMLLQTWKRHDMCVVVDPCHYPQWVSDRYEHYKLLYWRGRGEDMVDDFAHEKQSPIFGEAWIYNVLQHVDDPEKVVRNALAIAKTVRVFEWINIQPYEGHPHMLTKANLDAWLGVDGQTGIINEPQWAMVGGEYYAAVKET